MQTDEIQSNPMDFILLPTWVHKKISVNYKSLVIAFLFVGIFDIVFYKNLVDANFFKGSLEELLIRSFLYIILAIILGAIDLICTMVPISELATLIGKRSEKFVSKRIYVVMMKSYAISHLIFVIPYALFVYLGVNWQSIDMNSSSQMRLLYSILAVVIIILPYAQLGILYRTLSIRTRIERFSKLLLILATFFWMKISSEAVLYVTSLFHDVIIKVSESQPLAGFPWFG